jgi:hypothetical protein
MPDDVRRLLERAVDWYTPQPPDPSDARRRSRARARRGKAAIVLLASILVSASLIWLFAAFGSLRAPIDRPVPGSSSQRDTTRQELELEAAALAKRVNTLQRELEAAVKRLGSLYDQYKTAVESSVTPSRLREVRARIEATRALVAQVKHELSAVKERLSNVTRELSRWSPGAGSSGSPSGVGLSRCTQTTTTGDFDGDGSGDEATIVAVVPADVSCDRNGDVYTQLQSQRIEVAFGSGQMLDQPLTDCQPCLTGSLVFAATDLDGDGRDEVAIDVGPGAATDYVEFFRVDPRAVHPLVVDDPGDPPYVRPGPAILGGGFDSGLWSPIECRVDAEGTRALVSVHAENMTGPITGPWKVHRTTMFLRGDDLVVVAVSDDQSKDYFSRRSEVFQNGCS